MEGVLVTGGSPSSRASARDALEPITDEVDAGFQELFVYDSGRSADDEDDEVRRLEGDLLGHEPVAGCGSDRAALPAAVLGRLSRAVPECGARLADDPDHAHEAAADPRWAGLAALQPDED
ncbi:MAG: hypothetical protein U0R78_09845 [Nocardioidaceae bacterium]